MFWTDHFFASCVYTMTLGKFHLQWVLRGSRRQFYFTMDPKIGQSRVWALDLPIRIPGRNPLGHESSLPPVSPSRVTLPKANDLKPAIFRKQQRMVKPSRQFYLSRIKLKRHKLRLRGAGSRRKGPLSSGKKAHGY